jgi:uncharacterized membrane protein YhfC
MYGLLYGLGGGLLILALRVIEYRFLVIQHSFEIYGGLIAVLFAGVGIWLGLKLTRKRRLSSYVRFRECESAIYR